MSIFSRQINPHTALIGVVHVQALPGADGYGGKMEQIIEKAIYDARLYREAGLDAIIIENMHDVPYLRGNVEPETVAAMAVVGKAVKETSQLPIGIQILAGANQAALGVAVALDLDFIRVEGFVFAHVGDEGFHNSDAATLVRKRASLGARQIKIFADIKKKHSAHAITQDVSIEETAHAAQFFKADGIILTGTSTGVAASIDELKAVKASFAGKAYPILIGSGITEQNLATFAPLANGLIVGSFVKREGYWANEVEKERVTLLVNSLKKLKTN
jgi:membrane complex biogenesis BtpA family protein